MKLFKIIRTLFVCVLVLLFTVTGVLLYQFPSTHSGYNFLIFTEVVCVVCVFVAYSNWHNIETA